MSLVTQGGSGNLIADNWLVNGADLTHGVAHQAANVLTR